MHGVNQLRLNPLTGRWVTVATGRASRPGDFATDQGHPADDPASARRAEYKLSRDDRIGRIAERPARRRSGASRIPESRALGCNQLIRLSYLLFWSRDTLAPVAGSNKIADMN